MSVFDQNISVTMSRGDLTGTPLYSVPDGYSIRTYGSGDEHAWVQIQSAADRYNSITLDLFWREFGEDPYVLSQRQFYLLDSQGKAVGTATAWFDPSYQGKPYGRIHWVAIHPDSQGQGLSKPLLSRVCSRLQELGHDRAYLVTSAARVAAINLYLHFGFVPDVRRAEDESVWTQVNRHLEELAKRNQRDMPNQGIQPTS